VRRRRARGSWETAPGVDVQAHSADQQPGRCRPPIRAVGGDRDLRAVHVDRLGPGLLGETVEDPPQGCDALGADGELDTGAVRGPGQRPGEVAGVGAQPDPPAPRRGRQRPQRPGQQVGGVRAGVLVAGHQVRGQRRRGLRPGGHVRTPAAWPLVVERDPPFLGSVVLHVGGVQIDGDRIAERRCPPWWQRREHRGVNVADPGLRRAPLPLGELARQPGGGRRAQGGHRREHLTGHISASAVQPDQEVLPGQLRTGQPDQQLSPAKPPTTGLDRPDRRIQQLDHAQPVDQLGHRSHPRHRGQRQVRRADAHPPPQPTHTP